MKTNPNHPASPTENGLIYDHSANCINVENVGLTKREQFAAMAMQGILASYEPGRIDYRDVATDAVTCAKALIAALNKEEQ